MPSRETGAARAPTSFELIGPAQPSDSSDALAEENARLRVAIYHLQHALDSRGGIEQAKGMVMSRYAIDAEAAFQVLVRLSQNSNVKVVDIAREIVATHGQGGRWLA